MLELPGKVTSHIAKNDVVHDMLQLRNCFPYRTRSLAMSNAYLIVILSVNNIVHVNEKNRKQVTAVLKIVKGSHPLPPKKHAGGGGERERERIWKKSEKNYFCVELFPSDEAKRTIMVQCWRVGMWIQPYTDCFCTRTLYAKVYRFTPS